MFCGKLAALEDRAGRGRSVGNCWLLHRPDEI